ncbi:MAG: imidazole glycerol phosphate synthase subunit HisH [Gammaproteobacteria bacterium]|nr:imidazole glycerol phosphate synthase subunit HisH [Gammaproteobacteria bacterium]
MTPIVVIDYGMGNLRSVAKALEAVSDDRPVRVSADPGLIAAAGHVVFPGQGAMGSCMRRLRELDLVEVIATAAATKPFLGVCLGLQALFEQSAEDGGCEGLGLLPGEVTRLPGGAEPDGRPLKIPHMGWNRVRQAKPHPLWAGVPEESWFYFVHSYRIEPGVSTDQAATTDYGGRFVSAVARGNLFAVQFHPEKSHHAGLRLLHNFVHWDGCP